MHPTHALLERAGDVVLLEGEVTLPLLVPVETGKVAHGVVGPSRAPRGVRLSFSKPRTPHAALSVGIMPRSSTPGTIQGEYDGLLS